MLPRSGERQRVNAVLEEQAAKDAKPIADLRVAHLEHVAKLCRIARVTRRLAVAALKQQFSRADTAPSFDFGSCKI